MSAYQPPRRVTSTATTVTVQAAATTALATASNALGSNQFVQFHGNDLNLRTAHPFAGNQFIGNNNPTTTEDGGSNANSSLDWASKGCYDSQTKRAMWLSTGQGTNNSAGTYVRNTHPIYDETYNGGAGRWTVNRGFKANTQDATAPAVNHLYDSICIDVVGRRLYKSFLGINSIMVYDLDSGAYTLMNGPPQDSALRTGALEFIPTRGANGAIWCYGEVQNVSTIWEWQIGGSGWQALTLTGASFTSFTQAALPMSYNPRSNRVFCGGNGTDFYIINPSTLAMTALTVSSSVTDSFNSPHKAKLCKDPAGNGWLYFSQVDGRIWRCSETGTWTQRAACPSPLNQVVGVHAFIMIPIDVYGVVWFVGDTYTFNNSNNPVPENPQAWLYKP